MKRNGFLTFLAALIPGVGYMYLGFIRRGIQFLLLYLLIEPVFKLVGLGFLASFVKIPIWFYTFFDTFNLAEKMDRGEIVYDKDIFGDFYFEDRLGDIMNSKLTFIIGWLLILTGIFSILNKIFYDYEIYNLIKSYVKTYFIPVSFIIIGGYLIFKGKK
ncbi:hypothetical protein SAMN05660865_01554 [Caloramator fervidus]|uniref:TM2 domain-containing protein n=1 Tax=Caloramator fervidus TaxID=29344 RepID=A0A1H5WQG5_9CLOT|nr:hypothetical protein [Caloramator fervidus]SEG01732.1 hypothetical protein SAMN05660865_01554 [Caloramator fervidus]